MKRPFKFAALASIACSAACGGNPSAEPASPGTPLQTEYSATLPDGRGAIMVLEPASGSHWGGSLEILGSDPPVAEDFDGTHEGATFRATGQKEDGGRFTLSATRLPNGHLSVVHSDFGQPIDFEPLVLDPAPVSARIPHTLGLKFSHDDQWRVITLETTPYAHSTNFEHYRGRMSNHDVALYYYVPSGGGVFYFYLGAFGKKPYLQVSPTVKVEDLPRGFGGPGYVFSDTILAGSLSFRFGTP